MAVVWHGITAIVLLSGAVKVYAARSGGMRSAVAFVAAQYLALAALFVVYGLLRFGSLWAIPQWTLFIAIVGLVAMGLRRPTGVKRTQAAR